MAMDKLLAAKPLAVASVAGFLLIAGYDIADAVSDLPAMPERLHELGLFVTMTLAAVASFAHYTARSVAPVREAFIHGYKLAAQQKRRCDCAKGVDDADEGRDAKVLHLPPSVYTVGNNAISPQVQVPGPQHRAPSPRRPY